ncbi:MAG: hypothetical protein K6G83_01075 [Lachnospiraceae bacterium]|nr:hypothetical protein [Lachnospiraceae bacterium]
MIILNKKKSHSVDFLLMYESKVRELEGICLIANELAGRGYSVGIFNKWPSFLYGQVIRPSAKVLLIPSAYRDPSLYILLAKVKGASSVINLQWEQIYSRRDLTNPDSPWKITGDVRKVTHISWGDVNYSKLTKEDGVESRLVKKVGHVGLDYLRPGLRGFYRTREELCQEFGIQPETKLCLFISSFSFTNLPENMVEPELKELYRVSYESQRIILEWIMKVLAKYPGMTFVYRPHPSEANNRALWDLAAQNDHFKVIKDYSVKQWILICDTIYNWYSTSLAEVYFAGKSCYFLRPCVIPAEYECLIMEELESLKTYEEFEGSLFSTECALPVPEEVILENYSYDENCPTYQKIADVAEELYRSGDSRFEHKRTGKDTIDNLKLVLKASFLGKLRKKLGLQSPVKPQDAEYEDYITQMYRNNIVTEEEFLSMIDRLKRVL